MKARLLRCLALSLGCEDTGQPRDPVRGKQACGGCAMLVSDPAHAAQLVTPDGTRVFFDDVGCMAASVLESRLTPARTWVRAEGGGCVDARSARSARGGRPPMDFGFAPSVKDNASWADVEQAARTRTQRR